LPFSEKSKLIWLETPTNPTLKITDIAAIAIKAKQHNCLLAVDNTFCSPYFQTPLELGADLVVHSVTKYIGGHSDVVMGVVCTNNDDLYQKLRFIQNGIGAVPSPFDCFLAHRGLKTLHVRMEASARYALKIDVRDFAMHLTQRRLFLQKCSCDCAFPREPQRRFQGGVSRLAVAPRARTRQSSATWFWSHDYVLLCRVA
jgi:O-acetylhomoserine/O-acetylserine sulfhydrylase-like pyridoxal-dependent enzyme